MRPYINTKSGNRDIQQVNDRIGTSLRTVMDKDILDGQGIYNVTLTSGSNVIPHGLGRAPLNYHLSKQSQGDVWDSQATNKQATTTLILNTNVSTMTVSLWVY